MTNPVDLSFGWQMPEDETFIGRLMTGPDYRFRGWVDWEIETISARDGDDSEGRYGRKPTPERPAQAKRIVAYRYIRPVAGVKYRFERLTGKLLDGHDEMTAEELAALPIPAPFARSRYLKAA